MLSQNIVLVKAIKYIESYTVKNLDIKNKTQCYMILPLKHS